MGKHHGVEQSETPRDRGGGEEREGGQQIRTEENSAQCVQISFITEIEPIRDDALHDETTGKGVQDEKSGQLRQDLPGSLITDCSLLRIRFELCYNGR